MMMTTYINKITIFTIVLIVGFNNVVMGEIPIDYLSKLREVRQGEWLELKLDLLALKMSFPAYRIKIIVNSNQKIQFTYNLSGAMAKHFTEKLEKTEAEKVIFYHAKGLSDSVENIIKNEFEIISYKFDLNLDFEGVFLGPGNGVDMKPREIARWKNGNIEWVR